MYLISVIPAAKILLPAPQILTYFSAQELPVGSLVSVPLKKKKVAAVVIKSNNLDSQKMALRKADFELRGILKIITPSPVLTNRQIQLAQWMYQYYWCPLGPIINMMLPDKIRTGKINFSVGDESTDQKSSGENSHPKQTLILVPEISLTAEIIKKYDAQNTAVLHSRLTDNQLCENWLKIESGEAKTVVGTMIAVFAPFANLKEILVKEEHSANYKSRQTPKFHVRETARTLAQLWNAAITLESPTPSIEAKWLNENKRINLRQIAPPDKQPTMEIVDLRAELKDGNFSIFGRQLQETLKNMLAKKRQAILFINRRGASSALLCRECGYISRCKNCEAPLIYHLQPPRLICHHCGHSEDPPNVCPDCHGTKIKFLSAGTQRVEAELKKLFPTTNISRMDSDIAKDEKTAEQIIKSFNDKKTRILVGTQMIFGRRLNKASLAAMMIADTLFRLPDFRSNEKTFQIISQLKKLCDKKLIIQTYSSENSAIKNAADGNYENFYKEEIVDRKLLSYPPFSQLIKIVYAHRSQKQTEQQIRIVAEKIKQQLLSSKLSPLVTILGPSPAFIPKIKNQYIWQIILKSRLDDLNARNKILQIIPPGWVVDVDPV